MNLTLLSLLGLFFLEGASAYFQSHHPVHPDHPYYHFGRITNLTAAGFENPTCHTATEYVVSSNTQFQFCIAHDKSYLTNGNSITNLVMVRGFMPTCRVLQLLYWMLLTTTATQPMPLPREAYFIDVGANIGCCTMHLAALGLPVISVEPVNEHVSIMMGTLQYNPAFNVELYHGAISTVTRNIKAKVRSQENNWGNTTVEEAAETDSSSQTLSQYSLDTLIGRKRVALVKIDCEGCEYEALLGARKVLHRIPIIKMELIQPLCK
jgi:FkbM family methyltransferase